jgi:hypothetical protein
MMKPGKTVAPVILIALVLAAVLAAPLAAGSDVTINYGFLPPGPYYSQVDTTALLRMSLASSGSFPRTDVDWKGPQGENVSCRPAGGGCTIHNEYSATGALIGATHEFWIAGQGRLPGKYTAVGKYCYPDPWAHVCYGWTELFRLEFYISAAGTVYTISGNAGVGGATLSYVDGVPRTTTADASGNYAFSALAGWTGTVTPSKPGYFFAPSSRAYTNLNGNHTEQNFGALPVGSRTYLPFALGPSTVMTFTLGAATLPLGAN